MNTNVSGGIQAQPQKSNTLYWESSMGPIAYDDQGTGPLVICVPSMGDVRAEYRLVAPMLVAAGYRVVTVDNRGHGESTTSGSDFSVAGVGSDLAGLLDYLHAGPAKIVADSMAAGAAVWLSAERPDLVERLVLVGPFVRGGGSKMANILYAILFSGFWGAASWISYYKTLYPSQKPTDFDVYTKNLEKNLKEPGRIKALKAMLCASKESSESRLSTVEKPTLVIMGSKDPDFPKPEDEAQFVATSLKGSYVIIEGAGHYPHAEFPEITSSKILDFLAQ